MQPLQETAVAKMPQFGIDEHHVDRESAFRDAGMKAGRYEILRSMVRPGQTHHAGSRRNVRGGALNEATHAPSLPYRLLRAARGR